MICKKIAKKQIIDILSISSCTMNSGLLYGQVLFFFICEDIFLLNILFFHVSECTKYYIIKFSFSFSSQVYIKQTNRQWTHFSFTLFMNLIPTYPPPQKWKISLCRVFTDFIFNIYSHFTNKMNKQWLFAFSKNVMHWNPRYYPIHIQFYL